MSIANFWRTALSVALSFASINLAAAQASDFPNQPVKLIVPFEVGGPTDLLSRILADTLGKKLGETVIVENRGGAGGAIGSEVIARAKPDGYTIGLATISTHVVNPACNKNIKYDPIKSFTPIALVARMPNILVVRSDLKVGDFQQLRTLLVNESEKYNLGTAGPCSFGHVMLEHLNQDLSTRIVHVPYRGSGPAVSDLLGGALDMMMDIYPLFGSHIQSGKLKPIAVAWENRLKALPDTPTFSELGLPEMSTTSWYGIVAPANLPEDRLKILSDKIGQSLEDPALQKKFADAYIYASKTSSPEAFKQFLTEQYQKESSFIKARQMGN